MSYHAAAVGLKTAAVREETVVAAGAAGVVVDTAAAVDKMAVGDSHHARPGPLFPGLVRPATVLVSKRKIPKTGRTNATVSINQSINRWDQFGFAKKLLTSGTGAGSVFFFFFFEGFFGGSGSAGGCGIR